MISSRHLSFSLLNQLMTASARLIVRHDTEGEWVLAGSPTNALGSSGLCGSPVKETWTFLHESPVELSYKAALSATPLTTAPCSPDMATENQMVGSSKKVSKSPLIKPVELSAPLSESDDGGVCSNYKMRKARSAGVGNNKSRNNRKK
jgi:hypothetical protein